MEPSPPVEALCAFLVLAVAYLLLRLVDDFSTVPGPLLRFAEASLVLLAAGLFLLPSDRPAWFEVLPVVYFTGFQLYSTAAFAGESRRSSGVTRRRMQAVALGSALLGLSTLAAGPGGWMPERHQPGPLLSEILAVTSAICYFLGFAPPRWVRHAWQVPEFRDFLGRVVSLPRLPDVVAIVQELERGVAASLGAPVARVLLWDEPSRMLRFFEGGKPFALAPDHTLAGRAFAEQRPAFSANVSRDDPAYARMSGERSTGAVLAAPITTGENRWGVLVVYAPRAPIFAREDLELLHLLADQAAVLLESHALIDEAARLRAREEVARLKEDFLSAAAHDLQTPLTTVLVQAQLLERQALRAPEAPPNLAGLRRVVSEAQRMRGLVHELMDASRLERGALLGTRERVNLVDLARDACERGGGGSHCVVLAEGPVEGSYDRARVAQLIEHLVENAMKFSPPGAEVRVRVWLEGGEARLAVTDHGIGIPASDLPHLFDRFHRGANVDDRRFPGMGLGLYICRGIVEAHGGRIWAASAPEVGTTFHVALPALAGSSTRSVA